MHEAGYGRVIGTKKQLFCSVLRFVRVPFVLTPSVLAVLRATGRWGCCLAAVVSPTRCSDGKATSGSSPKIVVVMTVNFRVPESPHVTEIEINSVCVM